MVEALDPHHQAVLPGRQLVLQLGHVRLVGRLRQPVGQDVHQQVKQDHTEGGRERESEQDHTEGGESVRTGPHC